MTPGTRVVIVGGGFGGLTAAKALRRAPVAVTLVDRQNHHLFQPLLYQVAMAGLAPSEIAAPIRSILARQANAKVLLDEVTRIDLVAKQVHCREGPSLAYDFLVLAPGARTHYFGHDEWAHYAPGLKSLDDAVEIRRRVLLAFEAAEREPSATERENLLNFIVIGAGPTGIELAGAIAELARYTLARDFRNVRPSEAKVLLLEGGPRVVPSFASELSDKSVLQLRELGVQVRTGAVVRDIDAHGVTLASGEKLRAGTVVWTAGVASSPLLQQLNLEVDRGGRAKVNPDCSLPGHPEVFVIGDAAYLLGDDGKPLPGVSPTAMQQARYVAKLIESEVRDSGKKREPFHYFDKGSMATIGRSRAIAQVGSLKLSGLFAWLAWLVVHIWYLIGFRNRILVLMDWAWAYLFYRRGARLITGGRLDAGAPAQSLPSTSGAESPTPRTAMPAAQVERARPLS